MLIIGYAGFGLLLLLSEIARIKRTGFKIDFLFGMSIAFAIAYSAIPCLLMSSEESAPVTLNEYAGFTVTKEVLSSALICIVAGYTAFKMSYILTMRSRRNVTTMRVDRTSTSSRTTGFTLIALGGGCLLGYIASIGIEPFLSAGAYFRGNTDAVFEFGIERTAFLRNAALITISGTVILLGLV